MKNITNFIKENKWHLIIILLGSILILIPAFHSNIWFDESYSVSIVKHSFLDIWKIGAADVHPILYYWMLKVVSLLFGNSILIYRLFSVIAIILLSILGLTHIRKDDNKKVGILFSLLVLFLPIMGNYALEIRMYSWAILFVSLMAIYARRILRNKTTKNCVLFGIFSLISCYMHYYALMAAGVVNLVMIIYIIKNKKNYQNIFKKFFLIEALQVLVYLPGIIVFIKQLLYVNSGYWITIQFPDIVAQILSFQFKGSLPTSMVIIYTISILAYIGYLIIRDIRKKQPIKDAVWAISIYLSVIALALIASIKTPVLNVRYLFVITGLWIYFFAYFLSKENKKWLLYSVCFIIMGFGIYNTSINVKANYGIDNGKQFDFLDKYGQPGDIIVYGNIFDQGGVLSAQYDKYKQYYINRYHWPVEEPCKAYAPVMEVKRDYDFLDGVNRIIIADNEWFDYYKDFPYKDEYKIIKEEIIHIQYLDYTFAFRILEKI